MSLCNITDLPAIQIDMCICSNSEIFFLLIPETLYALASRKMDCLANVNDFR